MKAVIGQNLSALELTRRFGYICIQRRGTVLRQRGACRFRPRSV
jgi:hypothetical protein